jgi:hypothetical protein
MSLLCSATGSLLLILVGLTLVGFRTARQVVVVPETNQSEARPKPLRPACVECREKVLLLHPGGKEVLLAELESSGGRRGFSAYDELLQHLLVNRDRQCLLLLIRPDGFEAFQRAMTLATASGGGPVDTLGRPPRGGFAVGYELVLRPGAIEVPKEPAEP